MSLLKIKFLHAELNLLLKFVRSNIFYISKRGVFIIPLLFLGIHQPAAAQVPEIVKNEVESQRLYENLQWLRLLHYKDKESLIDDKKFFLSLEGKQDPKKNSIHF